MAGNIFISYRRDDAKMTAGRLHDALARHFSKSSLFMDVDRLLAGQRFDKQLDNALSDCDVLLAVIGPRWMDILSERIADDENTPGAGDFVRDEIAAALKREIVVIPVLLDGAELPPKSALPPDLQNLVLHQKHDITYERFGRDVDDLAAAIKVVRKAGTKNTPGSPGVGRAAAAALLVALLGGGGYLAYDQWLANDVGTAVLNNETKAAATRAEPKTAANDETEQARLAREMALLREERKRELDQARRSSPAPASNPGSGNAFRDTLTDGAPCHFCPAMVVVPSGSFMMGSPNNEKKRSDDEGPQRSVSIATTFAAGQYEVTWDEWDACVADGGCDNGPVAERGGDNGWGTGRRPVIEVSWDDAMAYANWLSRKTGKPYRLMSESEWEYTARAGTSGRWSFAGNESGVCRYANHADESTPYTWKNKKCSDGVDRGTAPVGRYRPNAWGLYDMHGNVWEWVADCYSDSYDGAPTNGGARQSSNCAKRVARGGSWYKGVQYLRSANRRGRKPDARSNGVGFRVARDLGR